MLTKPVKIPCYKYKHNTNQSDYVFQTSFVSFVYHNVKVCIWKTIRWVLNLGVY